MTPRSLPFWTILTIAIVACSYWVLHTDPSIPPPREPAKCISEPPALSDLAQFPDWSDLDRYQGTISRSDFLREMNDIYTTSSAWLEWFDIGDDTVTIQTGTDEPYVLNFAPDGISAIPSRRWRSSDQLPPAPEAQPLNGLKIAIDPGHIGGRWAKMEERWFQFGDTIPVQEGDMTLKVAKLLKPQLEALGATVTLVRTDTEPVTDLRPDLLQDQAISSQSGGDIVKLAERLFYRTAEIRARGELVNQTIQPDLVLCLHFNADAWGDPNAPSLVGSNHFHMILNGGYTDSEVALADQRHDLLLNLLQRVHSEEAKISASVVSAFLEKNEMPPFPYNPLAGNVRNVDSNPYLWARNLLANRIYQCPVIYFEPYVMNSQEDYDRIQAGDYEGLREVAGKLRPSIFHEYADCATLGVERYYRSSRPTR